MGQYDPRWPYIHMTQEEAAQAAVDLQTKALLPAHVGRFNLARHAWNDPFDRISNSSQDKPYRLLTPRIGEQLALEARENRFVHWWRDVDRMASAEPGRNPWHI